jgi:hypothetical protein
MKAGVTGHQDLLDARPWCKSKILEFLDTNGVLTGITSLAEGTDQLYAECLFERGASLHVVVPCREYDLAFKSDQSRDQYQKYLSLADRITELDYPKPSQQAFFHAGKVVVGLSDIMVAIWDGQAARGLGGTADVVDYALEKRTPIVQIDPILKTVRKLSNGS